MTVVEWIVLATRASASTELGLSTIAWVTPTMSAGSLRKALALTSCCDGNGTRFPGCPMTKGVMSTGANCGGPGKTWAVPCASSEVPCGMFAIRATVAGSPGSDVSGTLTQIPGSIWMPAGLPRVSLTTASATCWR